MPLWVPILLALVTWSVYIGDRLLDARSGLRSGTFRQLRHRHIFHWRHRRVFLPVAVLAALAAARMLLALLPTASRAPDSLLAAATLAYFSGVHSRRRAPAWLAPLLSKEFLVGLLFTLGCALPAWSRLRMDTPRQLSLWPFAALIAFFIALAWLNCVSIARWEAHPFHAPTGILPRAMFLAGAGLFIALLLLAHQPRIAAVLCTGAISALLLALLDRHRRRLSPLALRAAADLVLLAPSILLPLAWILK
ncbi:MAG TPA: hypothetical protein VMV57_10180 [Terracidiphilus sp.]|nr:hypothetical protein [Terracidiphilus sp.]